MATQVQLRGGTTSEHSTFTGAVREVTVDTDKDVLVVHDGSTAGGKPMLSTTGGTMTGTTAHGDNIKSTWGTLPDLEIYHDGSDSIITDVGEGGVKIFTAGVNDSGFYKVGGETLATFEPDGAVTLYYDNSNKLATTNTGVDITGSVTCDNIVASDTYFALTQDDTSSKVNICGGTSDSHTLGGLITLYGKDYSGANTGGDVALDAGSNGAGVIRMKTGGNERLRIDSSGNVGVGVTPESWHSAYTVLQIGDTGAIGSVSGATDLSENWYINSSYADSYINTSEASKYRQNAGSHTFQVAPSGTADAAITWTTAMTIENDGDTTFGKYVACPTNGGIDSPELFLVGSGWNTAVGARELGAKIVCKHTYGSGGSGQTDARLEFNLNQSDATSYTTKLAILGDGDVEVSTGNLVIGTSGKGIDFSNTSDAGGMTSEVLDDYEEGTWTPVFYGATTAGTNSVTATGKYVKIGQSVTVFCYIDGNTLTGATGIASISGFPFTSLSGNPVVSTNGVGRWNKITLSTNAKQLSVVMLGGQTEANLRESYSTSATATQVSVTQLNAGFGAVFSLTYMAT